MLLQLHQLQLRRGEDDKVLNLTQTLNDSNAAGGSDTFRLIKANLTQTDVTGWDNIYLMDLQVGGTSKISVNNSGNTAIAGTLAVTGATTLTGALAANGGITCDTNAFTVEDTNWKHCQRRNISCYWSYRC